KKMCEIKGADIQELLHECPNAYYSVENGNVKNNYATVSYTKKLSGYARFVKPDPRLLKHSKLMDKHFCFSTEFEKDRFKQALFLVNTIRRKGGVYSQKISKLDYFLPFGENCLRTKNVMGIADGHIAIVTEEQLLDILEIDKNLYEEVKAWSMGKIRNYGLPKPKKPSNSSRETTDNKTKKD
ncbi:MAG: BRCT domain-containing protein, partial [Clostridia bacterium]|nr:BRCT domain-containing protein [Clostridia bacterium]